MNLYKVTGKNDGYTYVVANSFDRASILSGYRTVYVVELVQNDISIESGEQK